MAKRFECVWFGNDSSPHLMGNGTPKRKKCVCGGELRVEEGKWGVFAYDPQNRAYLAQDAVTAGLFEQKAAADRCADRLTKYDPIGHAGGYVVRWLPAHWLEG